MELRTVCIQAREVGALVEFYSKVFGHAPEVDGGVDYRFVAERLTVFRLEAGVAQPTQNAAVIYTVEEANAEYARLAALGLCGGEGPTDKPWGVRSFVICDPAGNIISFAQPL